ncbi:peptidoglycan-binding protein [Streptomyces sp. NPDC051662]|uniref:peptidoglycan-binding protein n=1 Tax=Streptomyces sp. NPDC051662 TaxID=3154750 RepID=UPI0034333CEA
MKRGNVILAALSLLAVAGGSTAFVALTSSDDSGTPRDSGLPPATAAVERENLSESVLADGTIGYAGKRKFNATAAGVLTWTAKAGSTVQRNGWLYAVDGGKVRLMYGSEPMYRMLKAGTEGGDVRQLEENLAALGYTGFTVDDEYTDLTARAVKRWQKANGDKQTGTLGPEDIAFASGAVRIESADISVGDLTAPGQAVLTATGPSRVITVRLDVEESASVKKGDSVTVTLPDGSSAPGRITTVGTQAKPGSDPDDDSPKITLKVTLDRADKTGALDQAPVTVRFVGETREGVLTVPIEALLALPDKGFGLQVVEHGKAREVRVELGLFAQGRVEVTGDGVRPGTKVGVPKV